MSRPRRRVGRRTFLTGAAAGAAAYAAPPLAAPALAAQTPAGQTAATPVPVDGPATPHHAGRPGADFMVDVLKSLGFEYVAANPGSSFRGLHESLINYGGNRAPELLTCLHEESAVAMAHGYAKIAGRPMMVMAHGTVGLQHASMALYNAYADHVPVYLVIGNILDAAYRRGDVEWAHAVQDATAMVRDYIKWDDTPVSLTHFAESAVRAYTVAMTAPHAPVVLVADAVMQEEPIPAADVPRLRIPKRASTSPPAGDPGAVAALATMLVEASNPRLIAGRVARTPSGLASLVELAELLQAPVQDMRFTLRMNFPTRHRLRMLPGSPVADADVILGLEHPEFYGNLYAMTPQNRYGMTSRPLFAEGTKIATLSSAPLLTRSNYQEFGRYIEADLAIVADAEATLPLLVEACRRRITPERRRAMDERGARIAAANRAAVERVVESAASGWGASPISTARLSAEVWNAIKDHDWSLVSDVSFISGWPMLLWDVTKHHQYIGWSGGYGIGYGLPAAVGAALANKAHGRLSVNIQCDGDLNYAPGVLWTAAHHRIPLLTVMHNNRAYHQERMYVTDIAGRTRRDVRRAGIGNDLTEPNIDYATLAKAYGVAGIGPIDRPADLGPALRRAVEIVLAGEPVLVDVLTQPR
ncbi:MAG: thiamine pyrophosphate-binding protein [Vicinamibacterales bacterium]